MKSLVWLVKCVDPQYRFRQTLRKELQEDQAKSEAGFMKFQDHHWLNLIHK